MDLELTVRYGDKERTVVWDSDPLDFCFVLEEGAKQLSYGDSLRGEQLTTAMRLSADVLGAAVNEVAGPLLYVTLSKQIRGPFTDEEKRLGEMLGELGCLDE